MRSSTGVLIEGFTMGPWLANGMGIEIDSNSYNCTVADNVIEGFTGGRLHVGIWITDSNDNSIFGNSFINNTEQVFLQNASDLRWDNGFEGNYWSDYSGWDNNKDGIGDVWYVINENNYDIYPLMSPHGSPPLPMYTLSIAVNGPGRTSRTPGNYTHSLGQQISLQANPDANYVLNHWEFDGTDLGSLVNPLEIVMNSSHTVVAVFSLPTYSVTVNSYCQIEGMDVGLDILMDGSPTGYKTPHTFTELWGTHTLTVPDNDANGHLFRHWSTSDTNTTITVSSSGTCVAYYSIRYTLVITSNDGGTTSPSPGNYSYWAGDASSITAFPDPGYYLDRWELDEVNVGMSSPLNITMNSNRTLQAVFKQLTSGDDVAIKWVASKSVVGQGYPLIVEVTAMNVGIYTETFNVSAYANATIIQTSTNVTLRSAEFTTIIFTGDTHGLAMGDYTISAYAEPVPNETETADNNLTGGLVYIGIPGDVEGNQKVDIIDILMVAKAFGTNLQSSNWNPNMDVDCNDKVDIIDLLITAKNYGKTNV